jgi:hypothetical protein
MRPWHQFGMFPHWFIGGGRHRIDLRHPDQAQNQGQYKDAPGDTLMMQGAVKPEYAQDEGEKEKRSIGGNKRRRLHDEINEMGEKPGGAETVAHDAQDEARPRQPPYFQAQGDTITGGEAEDSHAIQGEHTKLL